MRYSRICVLGGTGFVGKHLVAALADRGHRVRVLTRNRERHRELLVLPPVQLVEADIHDPGILDEQLAGCDAVINLVGILNEKGDNGRGFQHAHVELARKVVSACQKHNVGRLLHMSALGADAEGGPSYYLATKGEAEDLVHRAADRGLAVTSFRPSVIFGPGDGFFNRFAGLLRLTPGFFPLACPDARFAPVFVGDVVEAFLRTLEDRNYYGRRLELCGPHSYTLRELVEYTARCQGLHRTVLGLGPRLSRLQARLLEFAPGKPFSRDNYRSLQRDSVCTDNALPALGIEPSSIETRVPLYLAHKRYRDRRTRWRASAGR